MASNDLLIVGLGNPGSKYEDTRHNVGFLVVDELVRRWGGSLDVEKWKARYCRLNRFGCRIVLAEPQTFMNRSGTSVAQIAGFFKIPLENIVVIHDDLDMHPGRLKLVKGGGAGGHNGIRSISQCLGGSGFYRLKVGIGRPGQGNVHPEVPVESYVLSSMSSDERNLLDQRIDVIDEGFEFFLEKGAARAMSHINSVK